MFLIFSVKSRKDLQRKLELKLPLLRKSVAALYRAKSVQLCSFTAQ